jgi:hypothetical protein
MPEPPPICTTCRQPIRAGELRLIFSSGFHHTLSSDCVAAAVRWCVETGHEASSKHWRDFKSGEHRGDPHYQGLSDGAAEVESAIRAKYPEVKP